MLNPAEDFVLDKAECERLEKDLLCLDSTLNIADWDTLDSQPHRHMTASYREGEPERIRLGLATLRDREGKGFTFAVRAFKRKADQRYAVHFLVKGNPYAETPRSTLVADLFTELLKREDPALVRLDSERLAGLRLDGTYSRAFEYSVDANPQQLQQHLAELAQEYISDRNRCSNRVIVTAEESEGFRFGLIEVRCLTKPSKL